MPAQARIYREAPELYERVHYSHGEAEDEVRALLSWFKVKRARVLDLGCGTGVHAVLLARRGFSVTGLDISPAMLKLARKRGKGLDGLSFVEADIEADDLQGYGVQDLVMGLGNTISHLPRHSLLGLFGKLRRVIAPGGTLVFNALYWSSERRRTVMEKDGAGEISVVWEIEVKEGKGRATLLGHFVKEEYDQVYEVECYKPAEVVNLLWQAGFKHARWSTGLDFHGRDLSGANTVYYRAMVPR